jgi:hypothetical protein
MKSCNSCASAPCVGGQEAAFRAQKKNCGLTVSKFEPGAYYQGVLVLGEYVLVQVGVQLISPALADLRGASH